MSSTPDTRDAGGESARRGSTRTSSNFCIQFRCEFTLRGNYLDVKHYGEQARCMLLSIIHDAFSYVLLAEITGFSLENNRLFPPLSSARDSVS
jgi:hypothetical protein